MTTTKHWYCDSEELENNWFYWLLAGTTPGLEPYRILNLMWTKPLTPVTDAEGKQLSRPNGTPLIDPAGAKRLHCIAIGTPVWLMSDGDTVYGLDGKVPLLPDPELLSDLGSDHPMFRLEDPYWVQGMLVPQLIRDGYLLEHPINYSWNLMITDILSICHGIVLKFRQPSEEERDELAQEALIQVMRKLALHKLKYTPGRAPVFNLLTTTIHRCIYSIMNKATKRRNNINKLAADLHAGRLPKTSRSLRVYL